GQPRSAAPSQMPVHHVAIEIRAIAAAPGCDSLRQHLEDAVVLFAPEFAIGIRAAHAVEERVFVPVLATAHFHNLLRQDIERRSRNLNAIEITVPDGAYYSGTFQQVVSVVANNRPLGFAPLQCPERPTRCKVTAIERG